MWDIIYSGIYYLIYEQREWVFHRVIQTQENNGEHASAKPRVFWSIIFECLDIPVGNELELFMWLLKWIET